MTVAELIKALQVMPQDAPVWVPEESDMLAEVEEATSVTYNAEQNRVYIKGFWSS